MHFSDSFKKSLKLLLHPCSFFFPHLYPHVSVNPLFSIGAKRVQEVDALRGEKGAKLAAETMGSGETSLGDALWCCANLYSDIKLRLSHKRLMIFTCRDEPHEGDNTKDRQARTKASDLKETGMWKQRLLSLRKTCSTVLKIKSGCRNFAGKFQYCSQIWSFSLKIGYRCSFTLNVNFAAFIVLSMSIMDLLDKFFLSKVLS